MRRREFITLLGATVIGSRAVSAQTSPKDFHLGTVTPGMPLGENSPGGQILVRVLGERGYRLGQNLKFSSRGAMRKISSLPDILVEMNAIRVDALVILGHPTAVAAKSTGIPTVIAYGAGDPVATGLVQSLARPGGNITGISDDAVRADDQAVVAAQALTAQSSSGGYPMEPRRSGHDAALRDVG
jgi:putative ABC transport system substrate-binding protein